MNFEKKLQQLVGAGLLCVLTLLCACQKKTVQPQATLVPVIAKNTPSHTTLKSRADLLAAYGWTMEAQQQAFCHLLKSATVELDVTDLNKPQTTEEILSWLLTLIRETQAKFWNRQGGKERWQVGPLPWMQQNKDKTWTCLTQLGFVEAVTPASGSTGTVCILGASKGRMLARLQFLKTLIQDHKIQPKCIVLLSGERLVSEKIDGSPEELQKIAVAFDHKSWHEVTEMDILRYLVSQDPFFKAFEVIPVDTKATLNAEGAPCRPTTQSTVATWLAQNPQPGSVFFISNQPHVNPQEAGILSVFMANHTKGFEIKTVGAAFQHEGFPSAEAIKQGVEAIGGTLRALAPLILRKHEVSIPPSLRGEFQKMYQNDPYLTALLQELER